MIQRDNSPYWQWDLGRVVYTDQPFVHFALLSDREALVVEAEDGVAEVPNILMQDGRDIYAWAYDGTRVRQDCKLRDGLRINVHPRPKPQGYIYTPTEVVELEDLKQWVRDQITEFTMHPPSLKVGKVETLEPGESVTVENTGDELNAVLDFGIPRGEKGETGDKGETGPQGPRGETGAQGETGERGPQGEQGDPGKDGADGFSPTVDVNREGSTVTISVTNKDGQQTAQVSDGEKGEPGKRGTCWGTGEQVNDSGGEVPGQLEGDLYLNRSTNVYYQYVDGSWQRQGQLGGGGSGIYMLEVDENGDLRALVEDGQTPPNYEYDSGTGDLYVVFDEVV